MLISFIMYIFFCARKHYYMSKFKIVNLIDKLFITFAVFLIIYAWLNFYIRDLWTTFFLSILFTAACIFILYFFINKKQNHKTAHSNLQKEINDNFLAFKLTPKEEKLKLLNNIISKNFLTILRKNSLSYIKNNMKILVILATHIDSISQNDLINILDQYNTQDICGFEIICNEINPNLNTNIFKNKTVLITNKSKLFFDYFQRTNIYPNKENIVLNYNKLTWRDILKGFFTPQKAKAYFLYGLLLIFSSIILPYHAYYIVFGSMLLLFSIICKILPKFKEY